MSLLRKIAISALAVLGVAFTAEALARITYVVGQFNSVTSDEFSLKSKIATAPKQKPILAYMGSSYSASSVYVDFESAALNRQGVPCSVINLAMLGNGAAPAVQLQLLEQATTSGNKPAVVFLDVSPLAGFVMTKKATKSNSSQFPSYLFQYRDRFARLLRQVPAIISSPQSVSAGGFGAHEIANSNLGWNPKFDVTNSGLISGGISARHALTSSVNRPNFFDALEPIHEYCHQNNIKLVLVWYPTTVEVDKSFADLGITPATFISQCQQTATDWQASFLNLHGELDQIYFSDCDHLNAAGSYEVTKKMVQMLSTSKKFQDALKTEMP